MGLGAGTLVFVGVWGLLGHGFYGNPRVFDTFIYKNYGLQIRHGLVPYRDFAVEYPPGRARPCSSPRRLPGSTIGWRSVG